MDLAKQGNDWSKVNELKAEISEIEEKRFSLEKRQILAKRLLRELENVALEMALAEFNGKDIQDRYSKLKELENTIFNPPASGLR